MKNLTLLSMLIATIAVANDFKLPVNLPAQNILYSPSSPASPSSQKFFDTEAGRTVVVFLSSECPCSDSYVEELNELSASYGKLGVAFVGVHANPQESREAAKKYFDDKKLNFVVLDDAEQKYLQLFQAFKTPHAYIVRNRDRKIIYHGGVGSARHATADMKHFLKRALDQGDAPEPMQTKTMGCMIQRKDS